MKNTGNIPDNYSTFTLPSSWVPPSSREEFWLDLVASTMRIQMPTSPGHETACGTRDITGNPGLCSVSIIYVDPSVLLTSQSCAFRRLPSRRTNRTTQLTKAARTKANVCLTAWCKLDGRPSFPILFSTAHERAQYFQCGLRCCALQFPGLPTSTLSFCNTSLGHSLRLRDGCYATTCNTSTVGYQRGRPNASFRPLGYASGLRLEL